MKRFAIGDKVVCVNAEPMPNTHTQPLTKGETYTVIDFMYCTACGEQSIRIGNYPTYDRSILCLQDHEMDSEGWLWSGSRRFIKANEVERELEKALEEEDYELAILLRDI